MRKDQIKSANTESRGLFMFGSDITAKPTVEELAAYYEFLNSSTSVLNEFGIHIGTNGYSYLIEALKIIIDREIYDVRMKTDVYPLIAVKHGLKRYDPVEHSIRNSLKAAYKVCKNKYPDRHCILNSFDEKPTNKKFLLRAVQEVSDRLLKELSA
jgi:hypothetical protein